MIVIYNEVLDVMRSVLHMYRSQKRKENRENDGIKRQVDDERGYFYQQEAHSRGVGQVPPYLKRIHPRSDSNLLKKVGSSF